MSIEENWNRYKELLLSINRQGIENLVNYIDSTDFKISPASSRYHSNIKGGLCIHSLNVYDNMLKLKKYFYEALDDESIKLVALLHDLAKNGQYEYYIKNKKVYGSGSQKDDVGNFSWAQEGVYKIKDNELRDNIYGEHGVNSFIIANKYITLKEEEIAAIINHHMNLDNGKVREDISEIYDRYPLASLLHIADLLATYIDENKYMCNE